MKRLISTLLACFFFLALLAQEVKTFELRNNTGMNAVVSNYGARVMKLEVRNWNGRLEPVIKGYAHISNYKDDITLGATLINNAENAPLVSADKVWEVVSVESQTATFCCITDIINGEHKGKLRVSVTYTLSDQNALDIDYNVSSTISTHCQVTNGIVFNLSGDTNRSILKQYLWIDSYKTNALNANQKLAHKQKKMRYTSLDFNQPRELGERINNFQNGYNHTFQLRHPSKTQNPAAILFDEQSGRVMTVHICQPSLHINSYWKLSTGISFQPIRAGYDGNKKEINTAISPEKEFHSTTVFAFSTDPPLIMRREHIVK